MKNKQILIVDDFATSRRFLKKALKELGYSKCLEAEDGVVALEILNEKEIDLIIADWNMPRKNGVELLAAVRTSKGKHFPFLLMMMEPLESWISEGERAGMTGYFIKPFDIVSLSKTISGILQD